jgi:hypothetical protein
MRAPTVSWLGVMRVRFEVVQYGAETARLVSGNAKAFAWRL